MKSRLCNSIQSSALLLYEFTVRFVPNLYSCFFSDCIKGNFVHCRPVLLLPGFPSLIHFFLSVNFFSLTVPNPSKRVTVFVLV